MSDEVFSTRAIRESGKASRIAQLPTSVPIYFDPGLVAARTAAAAAAVPAGV